jgi:hypothetical protein
MSSLFCSDRRHGERIDYSQAIEGMQFLERKTTAPAQPPGG